MAISDKANNALQVRYDELRAQGLSKEEATAQIKGNLQKIGAYDKLKAQNAQGTTTTDLAKNTANVASQVAPKYDTIKAEYDDIQNKVKLAQTITPTQPIDNPPPVNNQVYNNGQVTQSAEQATFRTNGVQPTTTTTPKTTPTTKQTTTNETVDFNVGAGREQDILNNLNEGFKNDVAINKAITTGDYETYKNAYGYNTADATKKKILDAFFQARQPKTEEGIFEILKTGQKIYNPSITSNPKYKTANDMYSDYSTMKGFTSDQFSSALKSGELVKGTKLYNELIKDPVIASNIAKAEKLNLINKATINTDTITSTQTDSILSKNQTLKQALENGEIDDTEMKSLLSSPEIESLNKEVTDLKIKYDTIKAEYDDIENSVEEELKGTGATMSYKMALVAERQKGIFKKLEVARNTYNNKLGYLADLKKEKADLLNINMDLWKTQEERAYQERIAEEQQNREFDLKYGDIYSSDERVQQVAAERMAEQIQSQYKGLPFRRTVPEMAQDIISELKSGKTLDQISTDIQNAIKSKEEYKTYAQGAGLMEKPKDTTPNWTQDITTGKWFDANSTTRPDLQLGGQTSTGGTYGATGATNVLDYIKSKEGFRSEAYQDSGGKWTIGYGFTTVNGKPVVPGQTIDQATADKMLGEKIGNYQTFLTKINVPLSDVQKAALTSFEYNLGNGIWNKDAAPIIDMINQGDFAGAAEYMKLFNKAGGKVIKGLQNRRNEEAGMLLQSGGQGTVDMISKLGRGVITGYGGAYDKNRGLDIGGAGKENTPVEGLYGTVLKTGNSKYYGNYVIIDNGDGTNMRLSHLNKIDVKEGDKLSGQSIGLLGSTGNSTGPHLDITMFDDNGKNYSSSEVEQYLRNYKLAPTQTGTTTQTFTPSQITAFDKYAKSNNPKDLQTGGVSIKQYNQYKNQTPQISKDEQIANRQIQSKIEKDIESFKSIKNAYNSLNSIVKGGINEKNKSASDQALIMLFNKMLDPNSVVREGEYARTAQGQALLDNWSAKLNAIQYGGQGIDDNTRNEMLKVSKDLYNMYKDGVDNVEQTYLSTAIELGGTESFVKKYFEGIKKETQPTQQSTPTKTQTTTDMFKTKYGFSYKSNNFVGQTDLNNKIQELRKKGWSNQKIIDEAKKDGITLKF